MTRAVLTVAGAAIGSFFGPVGTAIGSTLGSLAGSYLDPEQVRGPRLEDLKATALEYGTPISYCIGHPRVPGVVIWSSEKQEVEHSSGGKGGGPEVTQYTYKQDVLYKLSCNGGGGVIKVFSNGKLIYNIDVNAPPGTVAASEDTDAWEAIEVFPGDVDQLPWSVYEAAVGVGNAPAYRGSVTVGITGLNLGGSGYAPNLTFELSGSGVDHSVLRTMFDDGTSEDQSPSGLGDGDITGGTVNVGGYLVTFNDFADKSVTWNDPALIWEASRKTVEFLFQYFENDVGAVSMFQWVHDSTGGSDVAIACTLTGDSFGQPILQFTQTDGGLEGVESGPLFEGETYHVAITIDALGEVIIWFDGVQIGSTGTNFTSSSSAYVKLGGTGAPSRVRQVNYLGVRVVDDLLYLDDFAPPSTFGPYVLAEASPADLAEVVEALAVRAGLDASYVDASALAGQTVEAMAISQVTPTRQVLETLMTAYSFGCVEGETLKFVPRGGAAVATIPYEDMGATEGDPTGERLPITIRSDIEYPAQVSITFADVFNDQQNGTQKSDRLIGGANGISAIQLPIGMQPQQAKRVADVVLLDGALAKTAIGPIGLTRKWAALEPTDPIILVDRSGSTFRTRIQKITDGGVVRQIEVVLDDASVVNSVALTNNTDNSSVIVRRVSPMVLEMLDIPLLRDADDGVNHYAAGAGDGSGTWPGGVAMRGINDAGYEDVAEWADAARLGVATSVLPDGPVGVFDEVSTVTVEMNGALENYTRDAILNGLAPAYLIGSEVLYARTATLGSGTTYTLSGLLRGRRGTDWATGEHGADERVVLLRPAGLRVIANQSSDLGIEYSFKGVTYGKSAASAEEILFTNTGVMAMPFAPVDIRASRAGGDVVLTWKRRTRLSCRFTGSAGINVPLGEASEAYEVDILDGDDVVRTLSVTAAEATYTEAQQITDFGEALEEITVAVRQMSALVGDGYSTMATIELPPAVGRYAFSYLGTGPFVSQSVSPGLSGTDEGVVLLRRLNLFSPIEMLFRSGSATLSKPLTSTGAATSSADALSAFGLSMAAASGNNSSGSVNSATFLPEQIGLFEKVTWTGDGSGARDIAHSLGVAPAFVLASTVSGASLNWWVYSSVLGGGSEMEMTEGGGAFGSGSSRFPSTSTSTGLKVGSGLNASGVSYVALAFATSGALLTAGTYTGNGSTQSITGLGFQPEVLIVRRVDTNAGRTLITSSEINGGSAPQYFLDDTGTPDSDAYVTLNADGFDVADFDDVNENAVTYQYIAIKPKA